jgi:cellulose synthase (UDP-forming)
VQQLHTRWSFAGRARLRLINRVNHLSTALYWLISFPFRIMVLAAPAVWWWTGASVIDARPDDLVRFMLPAITASIVFIAVYSGNRQLPILFDVSQLVPTMDLARSIVAGLLRPRGQTFRVTPKGRNTQRHTVHWRLLSPFLALAGITVTGLVANLPSNSALRGSSGYVLTVFWSLLSLVIALLTCLACVDQPRRRKDERFASGERAVALAPGRKQTPCTVRDISVGGACLIRPGGWPMMPAHGRLWLDDGALEVPFATIRTFGDQLAVRFEPTPPIRAALILKLFDPRYRPDLEYVDLSRAFATAIGRLFA